MTQQHKEYFQSTLGWDDAKIQRFLNHLIKHGLAWAFLDGQLIDRGFCQRFLSL